MDKVKATPTGITILLKDKTTSNIEVDTLSADPAALLNILVENIRLANESQNFQEFDLSLIHSAIHSF